jgi:hypothetical protein
MNTLMNPYEPSKYASSDVSVRAGAPIRLFGWIMWPVLLASNIAGPVVLAFPMTEATGRWGMGVAVVSFLILGWILCGYRPAVARKILLGAPFIAISQLLPVLHLMLGVFAIEMANRLGVASPANDFAVECITHESGGFLVTGIVGIGLLLSAHACGSLFEWAMPGRWYWASKTPQSHANIGQ